MIEIVHPTPPTKQRLWQEKLANLITAPEILLAKLKLDSKYLPSAKLACNLFPLRVTEHYLSQIEPSNIQDPLLRQILPIEDELVPAEGFVSNPLQENDFNPIPGLLHKYRSRVLLTISQSCAIHCRYCFRREFDYKTNNAGKKSWGKLLDYIKNDPNINEVIYSGGDPLTANDHFLAELTQQLATLPQLTRIRIHSRLPLLIPERINIDFIAWFTAHRNLKPIFILHCNHPNELSTEVIKSLERLHKANITLLNQSVLLKGVNDDSKTLIALSEKLFAANVMPYYLHLLDRVRGSSHFEVCKTKAQSLMQEVQAALPGYLVPKLVQEEPGLAAKTLISF